MAAQVISRARSFLLHRAPQMGNRLLVERCRSLSMVAALRALLFGLLEMDAYRRNFSPPVKSQPAYLTRSSCRIFGGHLCCRGGAAISRHKTSTFLPALHRSPIAYYFGAGRFASTAASARSRSVSYLGKSPCRRYPGRAPPAGSFGARL